MHRLLSPVLAFGLIAGLANPGAAQDDPKDIVAKAVAALGGAERLDKFRGSKTSTKGSIFAVQGSDFAFTSEIVGMHPNKLKISMRLEGMGVVRNVVQLIDGDKVSVTIDGNVAPLADAEKADLKQALERQRLMNLTGLLADNGYELKKLPDAKVNDKDVVGIQVVGKGLKETKIYFDKSTFLIAKLEYKGLDPTGGGDLKHETLLGEYRDFQGLKKPTKIIAMSDGKKLMEATVIKQEVMQKVDDKEFGD